MTTQSEPAPLPASIHPALASALLAHGYTTLTPVQQSVLDEGGSHADLLVSAQTGSGKTVAFGLAIATSLLGEAERFADAGHPLGLIIAPTRELALQVQREINWLYADARIRTATGVGGTDMRMERRALERGAHIVVGTPGRLRDHITRGALDLAGLRAVVLDEADEMLDLGFRDDLEFILAASPDDRRTLMFSATVPRAIAELAKTYQRDAMRITATASSEQHADIDYQLMPVRREEREHAIINTLLHSDSKSALIFCHTREAVRHLTARLANRGFSVVALSGELAQSERSSALQAMRDGRARVCVATDVAARGIDLPNLDLVIHADVPGNPATLLHRSGRTGRAGRKGVCILIVPEYRRKAAERVLAMAKLSATPTPAPGIAEIEARYRREIMDEALSATAPEEVEAGFVAELVEKVAPEKLAAAYLRQQLAMRPVPEEVSPVSLTDNRKSKRREPREDGGASFEAAGPRTPRADDMTDGVWFTLSVGRKHRADPKWLLPLICKAGGVTKRAVGSIRIEDAHTQFQISADKADAYARSLGATGEPEKGIRITPASGTPAARPAFKGKPSFKDKKVGAKGKHKGKRSDKPGGGPKGKPRARRRPE